MAFSNFDNFPTNRFLCLFGIIVFLYLAGSSIYTIFNIYNNETKYIKPLQPCLDNLNSVQSELSWENVSVKVEQAVNCFKDKELNSVSEKQFSQLVTLNKELSSFQDKNELDRTTLNTNLATIVREIQEQGSENDEGIKDKDYWLSISILFSIFLLLMLIFYYQCESHGYFES